MKNLHLLSTDKPSRLCLSNNSILTIIEEANYTFSHIQSVNIYITNNEEIRAGHWFWKPDMNMVFKAEYTPYKGCKKIILTTDPQLIADGVQAIDEDFLEWFVKNPSFERVEVIFLGAFNKVDSYKLIIPSKEEKQETLEEAADNYSKELTQVVAFYNGAKWQMDKQDDFIMGFLKFIEGTYSYSNIHDYWYLHADTSKTYSKKQLLKVYLKSK